MIAPFDLNLRHLRAVPLIVEVGGIGAAADGVSLSQPALTQGLAKIERHLGVRLFDRLPGGMAATDAGRIVAERVAAAMGHLTSAMRSGRGFARPERLVTATQLRAFLALAEAGSFVGAAQATGWSQPALHRAVRDLEQLVARALVERRGRGVMLTGEGRRLARGIRLFAAEIAAAIAETRPDGSLNGRLVVGAMPLSRAVLLPMAVARLIRAAPNATIEIIEGSWRELIEPLRDGAIDLMVGALRDAPYPVGVTQTALVDDRLVIVARAEHPLAGTDNPSPAQLGAYPWIVGSAATPLRAHWDALFAGSPPPAPIVCGSVMTIRGILADSDCLTLLSPDQIALEVATGILAHVGQPRADLVRMIGMSTREGWRPTALQACFVDLLRVAGERA